MSAKSTIAEVIRKAEAGDHGPAIEAVKRYIHNVGAKLEVCKPYAGPEGPEPTPSELSQLVYMLRRNAPRCRSGSPTAAGA